MSTPGDLPARTLPTPGDLPARTLPTPGDLPARTLPTPGDLLAARSPQRARADKAIRRPAGPNTAERTVVAARRARG